MIEVRAIETQLFGKGGVLVATVKIHITGGKYPLVVEYAGATYALVDGRYVAADVVAAIPS